MPSAKIPFTLLFVEALSTKFFRILQSCASSLVTSKDTISSPNFSSISSINNIIRTLVRLHVYWGYLALLFQRGIVDKIIETKETMKDPYPNTTLPTLSLAINQVYCLKKTNRVTFYFYRRIIHLC